MAAIWHSFKGRFSSKPKPLPQQPKKSGKKDDEPRPKPDAQPMLLSVDDHKAEGVGKDHNEVLFQDSSKLWFHCGVRNSETGEPIPMRKMDEFVELFGFTAHIETVCWFTNDQSESDAEEVIFNFPLPCNAALFDFRAELNGKLVVATIKGKEVAEKEYERAVREKKTAALLREKNDYSEVFEIKLGALPRGESIKLSFSHVKQLETVGTGERKQFHHHKDVDKESERIRLPKLLGEDYKIDRFGVIEIMQRQTSWQEEQEQDQDQECQSQTTITMDSDCRIVSENQGSFDLIDQNKNGSTYHGRSSKSFGDVEIEVLKSKDELRAVIEPGRVYPGGFLGSSTLMLSYKTSLPPEKEVVSEEFIFVVDRSGSMEGALIKIAKETVEKFLLGLPHSPLNCYFNIVSFGSTYELLWERSQPCTVFNLKKALQVVSGFRGDLGGTNLLDPLKWVLEMESNSKERFIIVVTDGEVDNTDEVIRFCKGHQAKNTIYAFGVGSGADEKLVKGVAGKDLGLMTNRMNLESCVKGAMDAVLSDFNCNIDVEFDMPEGYSVSKIDQPKVLVPGDKLVVFAEIEYRGRELRRAREENDVSIQNGQCIVTFTNPEGDRVKCEANFELVVRQRYIGLLEHLEGNHLLLNELLSFVEMGLPIHRLAAKRKILAWSLESGKESEMEALSIEANVLSPVTAFVAVIDGENITAEGKKPGLEFPKVFANNARALDQPKFVTAEMYIVDDDDDGMQSSSSDWGEDLAMMGQGQGGMECFKISGPADRNLSLEHEAKIATNLVLNQRSPPKTQCISTNDVDEFQLFTMMYRTCLSRLEKKYSTAVELVSATDMHVEVAKQGIKPDDWASFIKKRLTTIAILVIFDEREYEIKGNAYGSVDDLISLICRELPVTKDKIGELKLGNESLIPNQNNKTLLELGFRNGMKLLVNKL